MTCTGIEESVLAHLPLSSVLQAVLQVFHADCRVGHAELDQSQISVQSRKGVRASPHANRLCSRFEIQLIGTYHGTAYCRSSLSHCALYFYRATQSSHTVTLGSQFVCRSVL